ncbi:MAG: 50S ribosomal protein L11 methyltransferase [Bacteroidetes bacterium]|nr:MAG: 50S ribosomal protein L11 methyltransferase [Bacteroidota bacterium]
MNKTYLEVSITASSSQQELLIPTLIELGFQGFLEDDSGFKSYMDVSKWSEDRFNMLQNDLSSLLQTISSNAVFKFRTFQEENWNEQWEKSLRPVEVGEKIVIKPSWCEYDNVNKRIVIQIDPKMSFGTGYHETTRLTLQLLEKYLAFGSKVLDVGTGTGILAIAAIKLGASFAFGNDIDEWSIENAQENIIANGVSDKIDISYKSVQEISQNDFDIITANLTLNTNIELLPDFVRVLKPTGILLLSGLLQHDHEKMIEAITSQGLILLEELRENEWIALAARK